MRATVEVPGSTFWLKRFTCRNFIRCVVICFILYAGHRVVRRVALVVYAKTSLVHEAQASSGDEPQTIRGEPLLSHAAVMNYVFAN